jgi:hypothetical protein
VHSPTANEGMRTKAFLLEHHMILQGNRGKQLPESYRGHRSRKIFSARNVGVE